MIFTELYLNSTVFACQLRLYEIQSGKFNKYIDVFVDNAMRERENATHSEHNTNTNLLLNIVRCFVIHNTTDERLKHRRATNERRKKKAKLHDEKIHKTYYRPHIFINRRGLLVVNAN